MNKCEWCGKEFEGNGKRFCSRSCRSKYAASKVNNRVNNLKNYSPSLPKEGGWKCVWCDEVFRVRKDLYKHIREVHSRYDENGKRIPWNKGLKKETSQVIANASNKIKQMYKNGELTPPWKGRSHSKETKLLISEKMKKAHAENRAHNIG